MILVLNPAASIAWDEFVGPGFKGRTDTSAKKNARGPQELEMSVSRSSEGFPSQNMCKVSLSLLQVRRGPRKARVLGICPACRPVLVFHRTVACARDAAVSVGPAGESPSTYMPSDGVDAYGNSMCTS